MLVWNPPPVPVVMRYTTVPAATASTWWAGFGFQLNLATPSGSAHWRRQRPVDTSHNMTTPSSSPLAMYGPGVIERAGGGSRRNQGERECYEGVRERKDRREGGEKEVRGKEGADGRVWCRGRDKKEERDEHNEKEVLRERERERERENERERE